MPICFDLDGTLGHFGGGYALLRQALGDLWGEAPGREELGRCGGSTDWEIVEELHRNRFAVPFEEAHYDTFQHRCLVHFQEAFPDGSGAQLSHPGILEGLHRLAQQGLPVAVVSGNAPLLLEFKLARLGVAKGLPRLGSLPRLARTELLRRALAGCRGPHLYLGDRPHDLRAAREAGIPFIGVGDLVPGAHPSLPAEATADQVLATVERVLRSGVPGPPAKDAVLPLE